MSSSIVLTLTGVDQLAWDTAAIKNAIVDLALVYTQIDDRSVPIVKINLDNALRAYTVDPALLSSGKTYVFSIQAGDSTGANYISNTVSSVTPNVTPVPILNSIMSGSTTLTCSVTTPLAVAATASATAMKSSPQVVFVILPIVTLAESSFITVKKPYVSGTSDYVLTAADGIMNFVRYEVSCFILPDPADTLYTAESPMSATLIGETTDLPLAPTLLMSNNYTSYSINSPIVILYAVPRFEFYKKFSPDLVQLNIYSKAPDSSTFVKLPLDLRTLLSSINYDSYSNSYMANYNDFKPPANAVQGKWEFYATLQLSTGEGARSPSVFYDTHVKASAPLNYNVVVDPIAKTVNYSWTQPANFSTLKISEVDKYVIYLRNQDNSVYQEHLVHYNQTSYVMPLTVATLASIDDSKKPLNAMISLQTDSYNDSNTIGGGGAFPNIYGDFAVKEVILYSVPSNVVNYSAVADDSRITVNWSDDVTHKTNNTKNGSATIVITDGNLFSKTISTMGGAFITGLTNGTTYSVQIYAQEITPLAEPLLSPTSVTVSNLTPQPPPSAPNKPTILTAVGGDGTITVTYVDKTGTVEGQRPIDRYLYQTSLTGPGHTVITTPGTFTISGLTNGVPVTISLSAANNWDISETDSITVTPRGVSFIDNVVISDKTVTCQFHPNGFAISAYEVIGLTAAPKITDQIILSSSPTTIATSYPSSVSQITGFFTMTFTFTNISGPLSAVLLLISNTNNQTAFYNSLQRV